MAKKQVKNDAVFQFRCRASDLEKYRKAAKRDGFSSLTAWILWLMRQQEQAE